MTARTWIGEGGTAAGTETRLLDASAVLLAAVSHDLRAPLAAAKAAVGCLRSADIQLTAEDHDELLTTADESLDQLTYLLASLLDVSRLQAGAWPVLSRPADLEEIIARTLSGIGPQARVVMVRIPAGLPPVMADPPLMERVIANVIANALRYSPGGSPPLLTASVRGRSDARHAGTGGNSWRRPDHGHLGAYRARVAR